jgi:rfaE bifunctional protein nucleotidyltransferase chain/domain
MIIPKKWGFEDVVINLDYCGKRMFVREQHRCSVHCHRKKDEVLMVSDDDGLVWFEMGTDPEDMDGFFMQSNERVRVQPGSWHRFTALRDTTIMEFSTHDEPEDSVRKEPSGKVGDDEFRSLMQSFFSFQSRNRILTAEAAGVVAEELRRRGRVVGMCNGCFDLTHLGHVTLFEQAKSKCDVLFVAINSDESIRKIKGPGRPFVDFKGRLGMVASNRFVDYVVMSEDTDHLKIVEAIRPAVYVATTETGPKSPEGKVVASGGGRTEVVEMVPGYNTTAIAAKVSKAGK